MREGNGVFSDDVRAEFVPCERLKSGHLRLASRVCDIRYGVLIRTNLLDMDTSPWHATILPHGLERGH